MIIAVESEISRRYQAWRGTRSDALRRSSAHRQRSYVENRGATVEDEFDFSELTVGLSGLSSWAYVLRGLSSSHVSAGEGHRDGFEIRWMPPEPIPGDIPGGHLTLGVGAKKSMTLREGSITEEVRFGIACSAPQPVDALNARYVYPLQNLMTLATDHPNALIEFSVRRPNSQDMIHVLRGRSFHDANVAADLLPHKMIFSLEDVRDRAVDLVGKWIELSERLADVCNSYFAIQYRPAFVENRFQTVFQALEMYQRRRRRPDGQTASPVGSSHGGHLIQLLEEHRALVGPLFGNDLAGVVAELMRYWDYVVHGDSDIGDNPNDGDDPFWRTQKLMFLMKACLLTELGIATEDQVRLFQRNQMCIRILSLVEG